MSSHKLSHSPEKHPTVVSPALRINHPIPTILHVVVTSLHPLSGIVPNNCICCYI